MQNDSMQVLLADDDEDDRLLFRSFLMKSK